MPAGRELDRVRQRRVGERVRRRVGHRAGHVADRVVQHVVAHEHRVGVRRLVDALDACRPGRSRSRRSPRPGCIDAIMSSVTSTGARPPGTSTAPMTRSASRTARATAAAVARQRLDAALVDLVDPAQPVEVLVEQEHLGFHALRDPRRVPTDVARAEHDDARGPHAGRAAEQHAAPALARARGSARRSAAPCGRRPRSSARAAAAGRSRAAPSRTRRRSCRDVDAARGRRRDTRRGAGT